MGTSPRSIAEPASHTYPHQSMKLAITIVIIAAALADTTTGTVIREKNSLGQTCGTTTEEQKKNNVMKPYGTACEVLLSAEKAFETCDKPGEDGGKPEEDDNCVRKELGMSFEKSLEIWGRLCGMNDWLACWNICKDTTDRCITDAEYKNLEAISETVDPTTVKPLSP